MGAETFTVTTETATTASVTVKSSQPMTASMENASPTAITLITGTGRIMMIPMASVCCTTLASESVRVIMEPVPKRSKSEPEYASDASYTAIRMSRPTLAASLEAR